MYFKHVIEKCDKLVYYLWAYIYSTYNEQTLQNELNIEVLVGDGISTLFSISITALFRMEK